MAKKANWQHVLWRWVWRNFKRRPVPFCTQMMMMHRSRNKKIYLSSSLPGNGHFPFLVTFVKKIAFFGSVFSDPLLFGWAHCLASKNSLKFKWKKCQSKDMLVSSVRVLNRTVSSVKIRVFFFLDIFSTQSCCEKAKTSRLFGMLEKLVSILSLIDAFIWDFMVEIW